MSVFFFVLEMDCGNVLMTVQDAKHGELFVGYKENNHPVAIDEASYVASKFITLYAAQTSLCKGADFSIEIENEAVSSNGIVLRDVEMIFDKVCARCGRPDRFARFNSPSQSLLCVPRPSA